MNPESLVRDKSFTSGFVFDWSTLFVQSETTSFFFSSRLYKRSQLYILYFDDSLDKCQTKNFGKYETSASGNL